MILYHGNMMINSKERRPALIIVFISVSVSVQVCVYF